MGNPAKKNGFILIDRRVLTEHLREIKSSAYVVYNCLAMHAGAEVDTPQGGQAAVSPTKAMRLLERERTCYPSLNTLMAETGFDKRTVRKALAILEAKNLIKIEGRKPRGRCGRKTYVLLPLSSVEPKGFFQEDGSPSLTAGVHSAPLAGVHSAPLAGVHSAPALSSCEQIQGTGPKNSSSRSQENHEPANGDGHPAAAAEAARPAKTPRLTATNGRRAAPRSADPAPSGKVEEPAAELEAALVSRGLPRDLAAEAARTKGAAFLREILAFFDRDRYVIPVRDPARALRTLVDKPATWGFEQTENGWKMPAPGWNQGAAATPEAQAERHARILAERAADERQRQAARANADGVAIREKLNKAMKGEKP